MDLRLFIALELPESFLQELEQDLAGLKRAHQEFRWTSRENQHLTLAFLGTVPEAGVPDILYALEKTIELWQKGQSYSSGIPVSAQGIYTFPPRKPASVLAVGLGDGKDTVTSLAAALEQELVAIKEQAHIAEYEASRRPFTPHITVARAGRSPLHLEPAERQIALHARGEISYVTLFSSVLQLGGPVYTVQGRFRLFT
jgi:2'-5' RNA ligase